MHLFGNRILTLALVAIAAVAIMNCGSTSSSGSSISSSTGSVTGTSGTLKAADGSPIAGAFHQSTQASRAESQSPSSIVRGPIPDRGMSRGRLPRLKENRPRKGVSAIQFRSGEGLHVGPAQAGRRRDRFDHPKSG